MTTNSYLRKRTSFLWLKWFMSHVGLPPRQKYLKASLLHPLLVICLGSSLRYIKILYYETIIMLTSIFSLIAAHSLIFTNIPLSSSEKSYVHVSSHSSYGLGMFECHNVTPSCCPLVSSNLFVLS